MKKDSIETLSSLTRTLHWCVAIGIFALLGVGVYMTDQKDYSLYPIHKSVGFLFFWLILLRVFWRMVNGWPHPTLDSHFSKKEHTLSLIVHWTLLLSTLLMPISGLLMSSMGGHGIYVFGLEIFPNNPDPSNLQKVLPLNSMLAGMGKNMHDWVSSILMAAIALHIAGVLKHHVMDKDSTLKRMMGIPSK